MVKSKRKASTKPNSSQTQGPGKLKFFLLFLLVLAVICVGSILTVHRYLQTTFVGNGPSTTDQVFAVPRGAGVSSIARKLEDEGLIENANMFKLLVRLEGKDTGLKAGEYVVPAGSNLREIYKTLSEGKAILYPFTAPEGLTSAQIMRAMSRVETLIDDAPETPAEGTLLPETYLTPRGMTRSALLKQMADAQQAFVMEAWKNRAPNLPITTIEEAIILASVVEKETGITSERDKVAGVFINRLNRGMRLESDPTIIYGISQGEPLGRGLRRSEIDRKTDWNTYQIPRLPKTPICNPGKDAILAVLNPGETDAIFFVADGTGGHAFAKNLSGHLANVKKWRAIERQRKRSQ